MLVALNQAMDQEIVEELDKENSVDDHLDVDPAGDERCRVGDINLSDNNAKNIKDTNHIYKQLVLRRRHPSTPFIPSFLTDPVGAAAFLGFGSLRSTNYRG